MATGSNEDNFDWVSAQGGCSAAQMFQLDQLFFGDSEDE